jgi:Putative transposase of IS4/5 family (DUF4096)
MFGDATPARLSGLEPDQKGCGGEVAVCDSPPPRWFGGADSKCGRKRLGRPADSWERPFPVILANAQWQRLEPLIQAARSSGRPRQTDMRAAMNAIFYLLRNRHLVGLRSCA